MPHGVVKTPRDEHLWDKAKEIAEDADQKENWPYVMGIFKKMNPKRFKSSLEAMARQLTKEYIGGCFMSGESKEAGVFKSPDDESKWERAKSIAEQDGRHGDWEYVMRVFEKLNPKCLQGGIKSATVRKVAAAEIEFQSQPLRMTRDYGSQEED